MEAEIAFLIGEDIEGPGITGAQVLAKTPVCYCLHLKSLIAVMKILTLHFPDVIADNASTS